MQGELTWTVRASPMTQPWPAEEQDRVNRRAEFDDVLDPLAFLGLDDDEDGEEQLAAPSTCDAKVVSVYGGKGHCAYHGYTDSFWANGRLWAYEDGTIAFIWLLDAHPILIKYTRLK
eukprot:gene19426-26083_t